MRAILLASLALTLAACGGDDGGPDAAPATCESYCDALLQNCSGAEAQFTNRDTCLDTCAAFDQGAPGAMAGNNLECRAYHAGAALGDPTMHCVHAGPGGAGVCGSNCEGLCTIVIDSCTAGNAVYASEQECLTACADFTDTEKYDAGDQAGNTLACRLYHATVATGDPVTHCEHTLPVSDACF